MLVYNPKIHSKENFVPGDPQNVSMYVCGPTPYDSAHLGHGRAAVVFDLLFRLLQQMEGFRVTYIRNFTDVDDKIIARANEAGIPPLQLSAKFAAEYLEDTRELACLEPTFQPKVSEEIPSILELIEKLIEQDHAYEADGNVYFSIGSFPEYGALSGRDTDSMLAGQRVEIDFRKRNELDFALWKAAKPGEPFWDSPWGPGRPGWHIECSAMSWRYAGTTLDIHGGGRDLLFPHHENERAQSMCAHNTVYARYWIHNGFVNVGTEKMSKSLKNFVTIREVLDQVPAAAVRWFVLASHYRSILDFTWRAIGDAMKSVDRVYQLKSALETLVQLDGNGHDAELDDATSLFKSTVAESLADDLNTPQAIAALHTYVTDINRWLDTNKKQKSRIAALDSLRNTESALQWFRELTGLLDTPTPAYFEESRNKAMRLLHIDAVSVEKDIANRIQARNEKNWQQADTLRLSLSDRGIQLLDNADGSTDWRVDIESIIAAISQQ